MSLTDLKGEFHLVYETINLVSGKIYRGVHSAQTEEDKYLGSGESLLRDIKKYGKKNFKRITICNCISREIAYKWESFFVDETFIARSDTYNDQIGGSAPFWLSEKWRQEISSLYHI